MTFIDKAWAWLVYSSNNRDKISLSIKGAIGTILVTVSLFAGDRNVPLLGDLLNGIVGALIAGLQAIVGLVSAVSLVIGLVRKVLTTIKGNNDVVLGFRE